MKSAVAACLATDSVTESALEGRACFPADFKGFAGHFPGRPIVPGVCLVQLIEACVEAITRTPIQIDELATAKFFSMVLPDQSFSVTCTCKDGVASGAITNDDGPVAKIKVRYSSAAA